MAVSCSLVAAGIIGAGLAIPLLLGKVPRNKAYGFRTSLTLSSDRIWYPANRHAAKGLILWAVANLIAGSVSFMFHPMEAGTRLLLTLVPLSVVILCLVSGLWVKRRFGARLRD